MTNIKIGDIIYYNGASDQLTTLGSSLITNYYTLTSSPHIAIVSDIELVDVHFLINKEKNIYKYIGEIFDIELKLNTVNEYYEFEIEKISE